MSVFGCDVVVVGGGMVGLSCALGLAQAGFVVAIVEANAHPQKDLPAPHAPFHPRVVACNPTTKAFLDTLQVWETLVETQRVGPYRRMVIWDACLEGRIQFDAFDAACVHLGYLVEQQGVTAALWQALERCPLVTFFLGESIERVVSDDAGISLTLRSGQQLRASLVVGADGTHSITRTLVGISVVARDYQQTALIATLETTLPHQETAYQRFGPEGPLALLPLARPTTSAIVWTLSPERAEQFCRYSSSQLCRLLTEESEGILGAIQTISPCHSFPLRAQYARRYVVPRCALVGDAAHTIHPLAGQGVNLGLQDSKALIEVLTRARSQRRDYGQLETLLRYERQRRWWNNGMGSAMTFLKEVFGSSSVFLQQLRSQGLSWVDRQKALKRLFIRMAQ